MRAQQVAFGDVRVATTGNADEPLAHPGMRERVVQPHPTGERDVVVGVAGHGHHGRSAGAHVLEWRAARRERGTRP